VESEQRIVIRTEVLRSRLGRPHPRSALDPNLRRRMGEAGRRVAAEKFNHKTNVARLILLYVL
jgi:hypothetical protein